MVKEILWNYKRSLLCVNEMSSSGKRYIETDVIFMINLATIIKTKSLFGLISLFHQ